MRVLMVCLGNICRSPTAAAALRAHAQRAGVMIDVDSCGTASWHVGKPAHGPTIAHAARRGLDLSTHRARTLSPDDAGFDAIFAMDRANLRDLRARLPSSCHARTALWLCDDEVPDPWGGTPDDFERVLDLCEAASLRFVDDVRDGKFG